MTFVARVTNDPRKAAVSGETRFTLLSFDAVAVTQRLPTAVTNHLSAGWARGAKPEQQEEQQPAGDEKLHEGSG